MIVSLDVPSIIHSMCCLGLQQICVIAVCKMDDWIKDYMEICYLLLLIIFSSSYGLNKYLLFLLIYMICTWHCTWHMHCAWIIYDGYMEIWLHNQIHLSHGSWVLVFPHPFNVLPRVAAYLCMEWRYDWNAKKNFKKFLNIHEETATMYQMDDTCNDCNYVSDRWHIQWLQLCIR